MASPFVELEVGERVVKLTNPDKVLFPKAGKTKRDLAEYYLAVGDGIVRALYERPTQLRRFPDGIEGEAIYQKRVPEKRPEWVETARVTFPSGRHADELCVTELAQVDLGGEPCRRRLPPLAVAAPRHGASRTSSASTSTRSRGRVQGREEGRRRRARGARGDRLHGLAEDLRQPRHPRLLPHRARVGVPGRSARRARVRARGRAARAEEGHDRVVEGAAREAGLHRLQPERARPDGGLRVLGAGADRRRGLGARDVGRAARTSRPRTSR